MNHFLYLSKLVLEELALLKLRITRMVSLQTMGVTVIHYNSKVKTSFCTKKVVKKAPKNPDFSFVLSRTKRQSTISFIQFSLWPEIWPYFHSEEQSKNLKKNHFDIQNQNMAKSQPMGQKLIRLRKLYFLELLNFEKIRGLYSFLIHGSWTEIWLYFGSEKQN